MDFETLTYEKQTLRVPDEVVEHTLRTIEDAFKRTWLTDIIDISVGQFREVAVQEFGEGDVPSFSIDEGDPVPEIPMTETTHDLEPIKVPSGGNATSVMLNHCLTKLHDTTTRVDITGLRFGFEGLIHEIMNDVTDRGLQIDKIYIPDSMDADVYDGFDPANFGEMYMSGQVTPDEVAHLVEREMSIRNASIKPARQPDIHGNCVYVVPQSFEATLFMNETLTVPSEGVMVWKQHFETNHTPLLVFEVA